MPEMNICVAGWYLEKFDEWYRSLHKLNKRFPVHVVSNRPSPYLDEIDLPYTTRPNTGLEWGAYNYYLMNIWQGGATLFCHDDIWLCPVVKDEKILEPEFVFERVATVPADQAYIFGSRAEDVENQGMHGRMVFMSHDFLSKVKSMGGFWYDGANRGYTNGDDAELKEKFNCLGYNSGIIRFHALAKSISEKVHAKIYVPAVDLAKRGTESSKDAYGKWIDSIGKKQQQAKNRLHVGCGTRADDGYTNVDLHSEVADIKADARDIPAPDETYDWVEAHHLLEHLPPEGAKDALREWHRLLIPGGHVFLSLPDSLALMGVLQGAQDNPDLWDGTMGAIYGNSKPGMSHQWGYCRESLTRLLEEIGFQDVSVKTVVGYRPTPSLMAIGRK